MSLQEKKLLFAMELSNKNWKLAFGDGTRVRERNLPAGKQLLLMEEIALAKEKLGLASDAPVVSCYEAGRDGFWIARMVEEQLREVEQVQQVAVAAP
jgi:transposase